MKKKNNKLELWQGRHNKSKTAYESQREKMDDYERLYRGDKGIVGADGVKSVKKATHVRNVVAELVESQVSSSIPQPKVTARRQEDEGLAKTIEDMLRNELDRLPFEEMNDQDERTSPIQGGDFFLVEWDNTARMRETVGELAVSVRHPKQLIPQEGVFSGIRDMDYYFMVLPQTKEYIKARYGVSLGDEAESDPDVKGLDEASAEGMVTQIVAYYKSKHGIGRFSWVGDTVLEDMEDYQARRLKACSKCGMTGSGDRCAYCDAAMEETEQDVEQLYEDIVRTDETVIPAFTPTQEVATGMDGEMYTQETEAPTQIPYYKPDVYPVVLRKNVSLFGSLLGDSDAAKMADQQDMIKRLSTKIGEKLMKGGSILTAPSSVNVKFSDEELMVLRVENPAQEAMIKVHTLQPNISGDMAYRAEVYEEARQVVGVTDSFQGRRDTTATSGKAKEFAAAQTAGRLESKRTMKNAAYAELFEVMFKFKLAYSDEPRSVVSTDYKGAKKYGVFNKYDFLKQDAAGEWYWNTDFLFSTDEAGGLANNREAMWQECRLNFQQGAYGNQAELNTLVRFWSRMSALNYPGASDTRDELEAEMQQQQAMQQQAMVQQQMMGQMPQGGMVAPDMAQMMGGALGGM